MSPRGEWTPDDVAMASRTIALIVFGGVLLGIFAAAANLYYVAAMIGLAVLIIMVAWQFEATLVVYSLLAFAVWGRSPNLATGGSGIGKGVYVSELMLGFLLAIWFARYLMGALPSNRIRSGFHIPIALYLAYSVLNVVHSFIFWDPHVSKAYQYTQVNIAELGLRFLSAGAFAMMATTVGSNRFLKWISVALCVPGFVCLATAIGPIKLPVAAQWWQLLALLPMSLCAAIALDSRTGLVKRIISAALVVVGVAEILISSITWVSGWTGLIAAIATVVYVKSRKAFAVFALAGVLLVAVFWPFFNSNVVQFSSEEGDFDRFALMAGGWRYATTFPLGVGLGNYRSYNAFYYGKLWGTTSYSSAHGTYSQHLAEMGVPGFLLLIAILVGGLTWMRRSYDKMRPGFSRTYILASLGQLVGIGVAAAIGDYIVPAYHNGGLATFSWTVYSWLIWGLAVAHVRVEGRSIDEEAGQV